MAQRYRETEEEVWAGGVKWVLVLRLTSPFRLGDHLTRLSETARCVPTTIPPFFVMQFTVQFSKDVKMITWVSVVVLGVVLSDIPLLAYLGIPAAAMLPAVTVPVLVVSVVLYCVLRFQVKGYTLDIDGLSIQRRWDKVNFPLDRIEAVEEDDEFRKSIRAWGVGDILGHYGKFKKIGGGHVYGLHHRFEKLYRDKNYRWPDCDFTA